MKTKPNKTTRRGSRNAARPARGRGRPPVYANDEERREVARWKGHLYQTDHAYKLRRRLRYAKDAAYREACRQRAREYAAAQAAPVAHAYRKKVLRHVESIDSFGTVAGSGRKATAWFSVPQFASVIARSPGVVRGWINAGRFPAPRDTLSGVRVYRRDHAVALARAVAEHLQTGAAHLTSGKRAAMIAFAAAVRR